MNARPQQDSALTPNKAPESNEPVHDLLDSHTAGGLVIRGGILRLASYVGVVLLSVLSAALLTRHLNVVRFGEYTTIISLVSVVSSITDAGMSVLGTREYAIRTGADREELMRDLLGLRITLTMMGVGLATAFAAAAGYAPSLLIGTVLAALSVVAVVFQHTLSIPLTTELRLGFLSLLEVARQAITVLLFVLLILLGAGVLPLLAVALVVNLLLIPPTAALVRGKISTRLILRPRRWRSLLGLTVAFSLASAANTIYLYTAQIITSLVAGKHQSGIFAASFRVFIVTAAVPGMLVAVALPVLSRAARDDRDRLGYSLQRIFDVSSTVGIAAALGMATGATFIIAVVAGPHYAASAGALRIEGVALLASFVLAVWGFGLLSLHRHRDLLISNIGALIVSASLTLILAKEHGARGAALASVCGEATLALLYLLTLVMHDRSLRPRLAITARALASALPGVALWLTVSLPSFLQPILALLLFGACLLALKAVPEELYALIPSRVRDMG
jgi:O-antigen/teichoic acid export membrane protein